MVSEPCGEWVLELGLERGQGMEQAGGWPTSCPSTGLGGRAAESRHKVPGTHGAGGER